MAPNPSYHARRIRVVAYVVLAVLTVAPFIEVVVASWPFRPSTPLWRFGLVGTLGGSLGTSALALLLSYAVAFAAGDRGTVRVVTIVCVVATAVLFVAIGMFGLDALQVKAQFGAAAATRFNVASTWALAKLALMAGVFATLAVSSYRVSSMMALETSHREPATRPLVATVGGRRKRRAEQLSTARPPESH